MLTTLVERVPGSRGAVFCDHEGESVAQVVRDGALSEYDMKVFGAQIAALWLSLQERTRECGAGSPVELRVVSAGGVLLCRTLPDGYYVVLLTGPKSSGGQAAFELRAAAAEIAREL
jgi:predicted regulator of Ras-like GTPase activity (Roadblock/LC7/MglB family)